MILSVGYRVSSTQATQFRIWATERLKEYIIKGFTMDDERLKNPHFVFGKDYFEEQLARIRDISRILVANKYQERHQILMSLHPSKKFCRPTFAGDSF